MRITLTIDDDVLDAARRVATAENKSVGSALSELARRGLASQSKSKTRLRFPAFKVSRDARPLTLERVNEALDD
ncbi:MAG TPA: CopG family transcriptional regulator [Thermoanaerobaculia bacterium]|nr:CopG family transcriptional regulator [Thermoanaerobaculia bacterium]